MVTPLLKAASYEPRIAILGIWGDTWLTRGNYGIYVAVRGSYGALTGSMWRLLPRKISPICCRVSYVALTRIHSLVLRITWHYVIIRYSYGNFLHCLTLLIRGGFTQRCDHGIKVISRNKKYVYLRERNELNIETYLSTALCVDALFTMLFCYLYIIYYYLSLLSLLVFLQKVRMKRHFMCIIQRRWRPNQSCWHEHCKLRNNNHKIGEGCGGVGLITDLICYI